MESNQIKSLSVTIKPQDNRCRYWAKIIRKNQLLPMPSTITGANDIKVEYSMRGEEELFEGDVLIEGEEMHHRRLRGWGYWLTMMGADGSLVRIRPTAERKAAMKANGLPSELLAGAGDIAACIRIAYAARLGIKFE